MCVVCRKIACCRHLEATSGCYSKAGLGEEADQRRWAGKYLTVISKLIDSGTCFSTPPFIRCFFLANCSHGHEVQVDYAKIGMIVV